ncbi:MAG: hypothetical protein JRJ84_07445 [Deltaproteobacteria bacterium]|nr:hypothetical protein [Deltaproteobacteria bacterium]
MHAPTAAVLFCTAVLPFTARDCTPTPTDPISGYPSVEICTGSEIDTYDLESLDIDGDELDIGISYSGGCANHDFTLCWDGSWSRSDTKIVNLYLVHDANGDTCEAWISDDLTFDVSLIPEELLVDYYWEYRANLRLEGETVMYYF